MNIQTMRAAVLRENQLRVCDIPVPTPSDGQILVRSLACGICASDIHFMDDPDNFADDKNGMWNPDPHANIVMGHEYCAEIVDYGPKTERKWPVGTRVSSVPIVITPQAMRIVGYSADAPGAYGQYFLMTEAFTQEVRSDLPSEYVAASDAMSVGWGYVSAAALGPKDIPLVIGLGAVGLSAVAAMRRKGIGPIIAVDFVPARRELAKIVGADIVIDPAVTSPYASWRELALGTPDATRSVLANADLARCVIFECVGREGVLDGIVRACEPYTRIYTTGTVGDHIPLKQAHIKGINIQFGGSPNLPQWNEAMEEVCSGRIDVRPIVGEVVTLDEMPDAFARVRRSDGPPRIIVNPQA